MRYLELIDEYALTTMKIEYIQDLMKKDKHLALVRKLEQLRGEQKYLAGKIDEYNGGEK